MTGRDGHPMRLRIEHTTVYAYDTPVLSSYNEARLLPQTEERQLTLEATVRTDPPAPQQRYWDIGGPRSRRSTCISRTTGSP